LHLGNLNAKRDWGHAKDYIEAMYLMLQQDQAEDFVIATGITTEIREFVRMAFAELGVQMSFKGEGVDEIGFVQSIDTAKFEAACGQASGLKVGDELVHVDPRYFRPTEVELLIGDATKARTKLGWTPRYSLPELVEDMIKADIKLMQKDQHLKAGGYEPHNYFE
jgi:GDPmannose 4,6-dehydratase